MKIIVIGDIHIGMNERTKAAFRGAITAMSELAGKVAIVSGHHRVKALESAHLHCEIGPTVPDDIVSIGEIDALRKLGICLTSTPTRLDDIYEPPELIEFPPVPDYPETRKVRLVASYTVPLRKSVVIPRAVRSTKCNKIIHIRNKRNRNQYRRGI